MQKIGRLIGMFVAGAFSACGVSQRIGADGDVRSDSSQWFAGDGGAEPDSTFRIDSDAFFEKDPPLMFCSFDGGTTPPYPLPGGTVDCPDDKNREGCPCSERGKTAPCWPGLRANRGLGICEDGVTTCTIRSEVSLAWGPCEGYVLPVEGATTGANACKCFSNGRWLIDNTVACFYYSGNTIAGARSSHLVNGNAVCDSASLPLMKPSQPWSTSTVKADCKGRFTLCYAVKAGDPMAPTANDCEVAKVCTSANYVQVGTAQTFPPLAAWVTSSTAQVNCAKLFESRGGYGEMTVSGESITCDAVTRTAMLGGYCPLTCSMTPNAPECQNCSQSSGGNF